MTDYLFGFLCGYSLAMITTSYARRRGRKPAPPAGPPAGPPEQPLQAQPIRLDEGTVQRGNGNGGPTTAKPQFPPPRKIREGLL